MSNTKDISDKMRKQMRNWTSGVAIASSNHAGHIHGMTISSFQSISMEPPRVLISLSKDTRTHLLVENSSTFAITVLAAKQKEISERFAGGPSEAEDRFHGIAHTISANGNPVIQGGLAFFDCRVVDTINAQSHTMFIADVIEVGLPKDSAVNQKPLVYFDQNYHQLAGQ